MEEKAALVENLVRRTADYGKTSYELVKLKALEKTAAVISTVVPYALLVFLFAAFLLFISLGLASLLGDAFGHMYLGMFVVALLYVVLGFALHFLMYKWLKTLLSDFVVNLILKS